MSVEFVYSFKWLQRAAARLEKFTRRHLSDGREAFLRLQMFNVRLVVRTPDHTEDGWCYAEVDTAARELARWDPQIESEPRGWIRPASCRRRLPIICASGRHQLGFLEYRRP